jgi:hypothetical protein
MHLPPIKMTKLHKIIGSYTVLVMNKERQEVATGTLMKYLGRVFVITVKHILENTDPNKIILSFGNPIRHSIDKHIYMHPKLDLAYIELSAGTVNLLLGPITNYFEPKSTLLIKVPMENGKAVLPCCGVGLPNAMHKMDFTDNTLYAWTLFFSGELEQYSSLPSELAGYEFDPRFHAWLNMSGTDFINEYGERSDFNIPPFGLSGCGIWIFKPETVDDDDPWYTLLGVQSSAIVKKRYLKIVGAQPLFHEIEHSTSLFMENSME